MCFTIEWWCFQSFLIASLQILGEEGLFNNLVSIAFSLFLLLQHTRSEVLPILIRLNRVSFSLFLLLLYQKALREGKLKIGHIKHFQSFLIASHTTKTRPSPLPPQPYSILSVFSYCFILKKHKKLDDDRQELVTFSLFLLLHRNWRWYYYNIHSWYQTSFSLFLLLLWTLGLIRSSTWLSVFSYCFMYGDTVYFSPISKTVVLIFQSFLIASLYLLV